VGVNNMAMSELGFRKVMVGTGWTVSLLISTNGLRKQSPHLNGPPFLVLKVFCDLDRQLLSP